MRLAADELGVERVTTARELTVDEIAALCATGVPIEVFCHGCDLHRLFGGRASSRPCGVDDRAMRGDCTQPCRLAYDLVERRDRALSPSRGIVCCVRMTIWVLRICPSL